MRITYRVYLFFLYIHEINHKQFQTIILVAITIKISLKSDYSWIQYLLPHLIRWPTSRDTSLYKKRGENQAGPVFTIVNCVDAWVIALELDHNVFTSLYLDDCISGCRYPNEMRYSFTRFRTNHSLRKYSFY